MGIGSARGDGRSVEAAGKAINSPLLEASMDGAYGVLLSIAGGSDLGLFEINEAASLVQEAAHPDANIIFGTVIDDSLGDEVRVTVIAAGFDSGAPTHKKLPGEMLGGGQPQGVAAGAPGRPGAATASAQAGQVRQSSPQPAIPPAVAAAPTMPTTPAVSREEAAASSSSSGAGSPRRVGGHGVDGECRGVVGRTRREDAGRGRRGRRPLLHALTPGRGAPGARRPGRHAG